MRKDYWLGANTIIPDYFCIKPIEGETQIIWQHTQSIPPQRPIDLDLEYSFNKLNWSTYTVNSTITTSVPVYFRGNNKVLGRTGGAQIRLVLNKLCDLSGRIGTIGNKIRSHQYIHGIKYVFRGNSTTPNQYIHSIKNLTLDLSLKGRESDWSTLEYMFGYCTSLIDTPKFDIVNYYLNVPAGFYGIYDNMFRGCVNLETLPKLNIKNIPNLAYHNMFSGCTKIKLSETQTGEYQNEFKIPYDGYGTIGDNSLDDMFESTGGTFTGTPSINTIYYTSNQVL